jgi:DNA-binding FrmR family transcriptional regulator
LAILEKLHEEVISAVDDAVRKLMFQLLRHYTEYSMTLKKEILELAVEAKFALLSGDTDAALNRLNKIIAILD